MAKYCKNNRVLEASAKLLESSTFELNEENDQATAVFMTREIAKNAGFNLADEVMVATAVSELATNILRYASCGSIRVIVIQNGDGRTGIEIGAEDKGKGIRDLKLAMQDNYSTGESLGLGLPSVERIMDEFEIESDIGQGTRIRARRWL